MKACNVLTTGLGVAMVVIVAVPSLMAQTAAAQTSSDVPAVCRPAPAAQAPGGAARVQRPPADPSVTVSAIAGLTPGGKWNKILTNEGPNADGIIANQDGHIMNAALGRTMIQTIDLRGSLVSEQSAVASVSGLGMDRQGRLFGFSRKNAGAAPGSPEAASKDGAIQYTPQRREFTHFADGSELGFRPSDIAPDNMGGAYLSVMGPCLYYAGADGLLHYADDAPRSASVALSPNERILYSMVRGIDGGPGKVVAYDIQSPGVLSNRRTLVTLEEGNGDSMAVDAGGRLYIPNERRVQVYDSEGKHLATLPMPDVAIAAALAGPDRKTLVILTEDSNPPLPGGERHISRSFYTLPLHTTGFPDRGR